MDALKTVVKAKRVVSLQLKSASLSNELPYQYLHIPYKNISRLWRSFIKYSCQENSLLDAFPQTYYQCEHDMLK